MKKSLQSHIMSHCAQPSSRIMFVNRYTGGYMRAHRRKQCVGMLGPDIQVKSAVLEILSVVIKAEAEDAAVAVEQLLDYRIDKVNGQTIVFWPELDSLISEDDRHPLET